MIYVVIVLFFLLVISDSPLIEGLRDKKRAELYCRYRLWKDVGNSESVIFFKRELYYLKEGIRLDVWDRSSQYASCWLEISRKEKKAFLNIQKTKC